MIVRDRAQLVTWAATRTKRRLGERCKEEGRGIPDDDDYSWRGAHHMQVLEV